MGEELTSLGSREMNSSSASSFSGPVQLWNTHRYFYVLSYVLQLQKMKSNAICHSHKNSVKTSLKVFQTIVFLFCPPTLYK
uniref:Uncharacterized protein n=1 Tax=Stegastes partitus TaxID=144197 RepID=A0A3B4ZWN0_9TELE